MQRTRSFVLMLATFASLFVLVAAPVAADSGSDSSGSSGSGSSSTDTTTSGSTGSGDSTTTGTTTDQTETSDSSTNQSVSDEVSQLRQDAKDALKTMREQEHNNSTTKGRELACQNRQSAINNRISDFATAAQRHLNVFTDIFTKVQTFYTTKGLNVSNYSTLVATVTAKQTAAQTAVDTLKSLDVKIDCTQPDPAQSLQTVKTAVANARTALQAYRQSIKDLIVAISNSIDTQTQSTTGGNQ